MFSSLLSFIMRFTLTLYRLQFNLLPSEGVQIILLFSSFNLLQICGDISNTCLIEPLFTQLPCLFHPSHSESLFSVTLFKPNLSLICISRYVDRLADSLKQKVSLEEKMLASREAVKQKRLDCLEDQTKLEPRVDALVGRTRELQKQV